MFAGRGNLKKEGKKSMSPLILFKLKTTYLVGGYTGGKRNRGNDDPERKVWSRTQIYEKVSLSGLGVILYFSSAEHNQGSKQRSDG